MYGVEECSNVIFSPFFFLAYSCPVSPAPLVEETVLSPLYILASFILD